VAYEWDENKAEANLSKHGVSFDEAKTAKTEDELRPEYDMQNLQVRKLGARRRKFCDTVRLEPDVVAAFSSAEAVNEALR
jgi:hypothetical protein